MTDNLIPAVVIVKFTSSTHEAMEVEIEAAADITNSDGKILLILDPKASQKLARELQAGLTPQARRRGPPPPAPKFVVKDDKGVNRTVEGNAPMILTHLRTMDAATRAASRNFLAFHLEGAQTSGDMATAVELLKVIEAIEAFSAPIDAWKAQESEPTPKTAKATKEAKGEGAA